MTRRELLFYQIDRLRVGYVNGRAGRALLGVAGITLAFVTLVSLADLGLRLHAGWCWLSWLLLVGAVVVGVGRVIRIARTPVSHEAMAVLIEKVVPGMDNHVINAVQFAETRVESPEFVDAVLAEVNPGLDRLQSRQLYSQRPAKVCAAILAVSLALLTLALILMPQRMGHALGRIVLPMAGIQPYTRTRITRIEPGDATVLRGETLSIEAKLQGDLSANAVVVWERARDRTDAVPLSRNDSDVGPFSGDLKGVFHDSRYRVEAGDARSKWFTITVTNPPGLEYWEAKVSPPDYVKRDAYVVDSSSTDAGIPVGSTVVLAGASNAPLSRADVVQDDVVTGSKETSGRLKFAVTFTMHDGGPVRLRLSSASGLESTSTLPFAVQPDQKPSVVLVDTRQRVVAAADAQIPVCFKAADDHAIVRVGFDRLVGDDSSEPISLASPPTEAREFAGRFLVDLASFDAREGDTLRFRVWAEDNGSDAFARRGYSPVVQITVPVLEDRRKARKTAAKDAEGGLRNLIKLQRENLKTTRQLADRAVLGTDIPNPQIQTAQMAQKNIRDLAGGLLQDRAALGDLATMLVGLVNHEMADVLECFESVHAAKAAERPGLLHECVHLETVILATLTGIPMGLANEQTHQEKTDLFAVLQRIVAAQRTNLTEAKAAQNAPVDVDRASRLAAVEDRIASDLVTFSDLCLVMIEDRIDDDFAKQLRMVYDLLDTQQAYEKILTAAEALEEADWATGIQRQEEAMRTLMEALNILNQWRMRNAKKLVGDAAEALRNTREKLTELESKQSEIAEVTRDLTKRGQIDDEVREKLRSMDLEQKEMASLVEQLANDLYQFPELPVCNELNSKMREILEDVEQAMGSENAPSIEIAVQKEDSLLDAIRSTKERVEDVEMWLPDVPDNFVWNMESFDADEFPDMPLVPLPDELEDIVGELLDQASDIDAQSQDSTGNNMVADMEMGWAVMDGPMPSFAAKGKSGNTRPNDNEMTGRSGAGREGQANGELVENHVKGLEGRATHARRTQDPFQKGMVTEDENSTMDARATGGGKLGGESETIGMFGQAARRDLHTGAHGGNPTKLRQETEALYATARLLYLGTGSLGSAARELRGVESAADRMKSFGSLHKRVLRRLEDTQVELNSGVVLPMPVATVSKTGGAVTDDVDINTISEEYRDAVSDYYRSLQDE